MHDWMRPSTHTRVEYRGYIIGDTGIDLRDKFSFRLVE